MTPAARVQTAIELLDRIIASAREKGPPADRILADWFKNNRFAGSKDRRAIRELVYGAVRVCGPVPSSGRAAMLRYADIEPAIGNLFDGSRYGPAILDETDRKAQGGVAPEWLMQKLDASNIAGRDAAALLDRAPLDLRVNTLKADKSSLILPISAEQTNAPYGLRIAAGTNVEQWDAYRDGQVEIQDTGSQLACLAIGAQPGETIVDLCAGGGGKTLAPFIKAEMDGEELQKTDVIPEDYFIPDDPGYACNNQCRCIWDIWILVKMSKTCPQHMSKTCQQHY